jgi:hypothetical protein
MPAYDQTATMNDVRNDSPLAGVEGDEDVGPFVLNLCPVAEPIVIPQPRPSSPARFTFFCSRGREGNVEKRWLHMGYFATRADAEKWLSVLQRVYPQAFVSQAELTFTPEHHATVHMMRQRERLP